MLKTQRDDSSDRIVLQGIDLRGLLIGLFLFASACLAHFAFSHTIYVTCIPNDGDHICEARSSGMFMVSYLQFAPEQLESLEVIEDDEDTPYLLLAAEGQEFRVQAVSPSRTTETQLQALHELRADLIALQDTPTIEPLRHRFRNSNNTRFGMFLFGGIGLLGLLVIPLLPHYRTEIIPSEERIIHQAYRIFSQKTQEFAFSDITQVIIEVSYERTGTYYYLALITRKGKSVQLEHGHKELETRESLREELEALIVG